MSFSVERRNCRRTIIRERTPRDHHKREDARDHKKEDAREINREGS
jgi:hypothetical protein